MNTYLVRTRDINHKVTNITQLTGDMALFKKSELIYLVLRKVRI